MDQVQAWVWRNQWIIPILIWLAVTVITEIFKPRTPEAYAKLPPRIAALLVSLGSVTNVSKLVEYAKRVITGWAQPPSAMLGLLLLVPLMQGCKDARAVDVGITPRSLNHGAEIGACLQSARDDIAAGKSNVCDAFNACQRAVARKYNLPETGRCVEVTPAAARDAGVPLSVLPYIEGSKHHVAAR